MKNNRTYPGFYYMLNTANLFLVYPNKRVEYYDRGKQKWKLADKYHGRLLINVVGKVKLMWR